MACVAFGLTASAALDLDLPPAAASAAAAPAESAAPLLTAFAPPLAVSGLGLHADVGKVIHCIRMTKVRLLPTYMQALMAAKQKRLD